MEKYKTVSFESIEKNKLSFLFVTATPVETKVLHESLDGITDDSILRVFEGKHTFYIGLMGKYLVVHVQCEMGSVGVHSSITTILNSIDKWNPKAVIMPGIAFGVNEKKQKIGDVLLSKSIIPYDSKRLGVNETLHRSTPTLSGSILFNRFKNLSKDWDGTILEGAVLSGESLIDNKTERDKLLSFFPEAIGGEMEGAGLYTAAANKNLEWLLVKGICDFADGNKAVNKDINQENAVKASVAFCNHVLQNEHAFTDLQCPLFSPIEVEILHKEPSRDVLFEVYRPEFEKFYINREIDELVAKKLEHFHIWVHGNSGVGKSSIVRKCLFIEKYRSINLSLGTCIDKSVTEIFNYIFYEISKANGNELSKIPTFDFQVAVTKIVILLNSIDIPQNTQLFLYIDEVPISSENSKEIINCFASLVQELNQKHSKVKLVIVSIFKASPSEIKANLKNVSENLIFTELGKWSQENLDQLFTIIQKEYNFLEIENKKDYVISSANGSPRVVKKIFKNYISQQGAELVVVVESTKRDLGL